MKEVLINVFCSDQLAGSPQYFRFFENERLRKEDFNTFQVTNEFDYSFVAVDSNRVTVNWKNKSGEIQFCGSAAYGLAWYLLKEKRNTTIELNSGSVNLTAQKENEKISLRFPGLVPQFVKKVDDRNIYYQRESGIYFIQVHDLSLLYSVDVASYCSEYNLKEIHGLCVFHWNGDRAQGSLRYFTPWHGRREDYVTGSIHQSLTPVIFELYQENEQCWRQESEKGGLLSSTLDGEYVTIQGRCLLNCLK